MKTLTREKAAVASKRCHTRIYAVLGLMMMMMMMHISEGLHLQYSSSFALLRLIFSIDSALLFSI